jgi:hypothetical protein
MSVSLLRGGDLTLLLELPLVREAIGATQGNAQIRQESTGSREIPARFPSQGSLFLIRRVKNLTLLDRIFSSSVYY